MIPVLYKEDEQIFSHNGIGALYESLSCDVVELENGSFTLELEYPVDGELYSELKDFRIIQAKPNDIDDPHNFRIYEIVKSIDDLSVYVRANTITNDLGDNLINKYVAKRNTAQEAMNGIKSNLVEPTNFDLISDIQTVSSSEWERINPLNAIVGTKGSLVDIWGGEIKRTNNAIYLFSRRGKDKVAVIRPGKNIEGLDMTVSTAGMITKILPTYTYRPVEIPKYEIVKLANGKTQKRRITKTGNTSMPDDITIIGDVVTSKHAKNYPINKWASVDYGDDVELKEKIDKFINSRLEEAEESSKVIDNSNFPKELKEFVTSELNKKAKQYFTHRNPGVDIPTVRIDVDMLQLSDSPEWEQFKNLELIRLTDTIEVWVEDYEIDVEVRVTELRYDSLGERVVSFEAGSDKPPRQTVQEKKYADLTKSLEDYKTTVQNGVNNIMRNTADGLNRKFEGYTEPPAELSSEGDIWFKQIGEGKVEIWIHDGVYWQPLMGEDFAEKIDKEIAEQQAKLEDFEKDLTTTTELANNVNNKAIQLELTYQDVKASLEDGEVFKAEVIRDFNSVTDRLSLIDGANGYINEIRRDVEGTKSSIVELKDDTVTKFNLIESDVKGTKQTVADLENKTSSQFNVMSDEISAVVGKVNNIGGRNLLKDSGRHIRHTNYKVGEWEITDYIEDGEEVTLSLYAKSYSHTQSFDIYNTDSSRRLRSYPVGQHDYSMKKWEFTFKWDNNARFSIEKGDYQSLILYNAPRNNGYAMEIEWIKLERGSVATDWSPAPEDGVSKDELISEINIQADRQIFRVGDNRLMITEDTTYMDNSVIKSAHIADLAVTGAKIADASISSAKMINLDVSKISGNISNFILSYWNDAAGGNVRITGSGIVTTASDQSQTYIQNGIVGTRNPDGATIGQIGYVRAGGSPVYTMRTALGANFSIIATTSSGTENMLRILPGSSEMYLDTKDTRVMGQLIVEGNTQMRNALYMGGKNVSQINKLQFYHGGSITSQSSNSNMVVSPSYNLVLRSRGSTALLFDSTHGYMHRTLSMEGNAITNQSDERLKRNIMPSFKDSLGKFSKLEFKWFEYLENLGLADGLHHGVMAQDVLKFAPEWVVEDERGYYSLNQSAMLMDAFKAIMQLSKKIKKLEAA